MKALKWRVVIPTYKRSDTLAKHSLATLERGGVRPSLIDIYVANEQEAEEYRSKIPKGSYAKLVVAEPGIQAARNFISRAYPDGQHLVQMDDDVRGVFAATSPKTLVEVTNLVEVFDGGFEACASVGARVWGMYPICNPFYMHGGQPVTTDLRPIIGVLHGVVNDQSLRLTCTGGKEDIERTLLYYEKDRAVVRFNNMAPKQNARTEKGGLQATNLRTHESSLADAKSLCSRWPRWVTMKPSFKGGHAEVRLRAK